MRLHRIVVLIGAYIPQSGTSLTKSQDGLLPWQVTSLRTWSPPYSPNVTLHSGMALTITDPNTLIAGPAHRGDAVFPPSTANCTTQWLDSEPPYGRMQNCSDVQYGYWVFEMLEPAANYTSPTTNFNVRFTRVSNVTVYGSIYAKVFMGTGHFEVGKNLGGLCGASGVCSFQLKNESAPVLVEQTRTMCSGDC